MKLQTALRAIYPPECIGCGEAVAEEFALCGACWSDTPFILGACCDTCGSPLPGHAEDTALQCDPCLKSPPPWSQGRAVMSYEGLGRRLVLGLKHADRSDVARAAAPWLARAAAPMLKGLTADRALVVPVPLHAGRLLRRRFNQSALLAQAFAKASGLPLGIDALVRQRATPSLGTQSAVERHKVMAGAISPHKHRGKSMVGKTVILVDDVMTSGATLGAATTAANLAGAKKVCVITLARADRHT